VGVEGMKGVVGAGNRGEFEGGVVGGKRRQLAYGKGKGLGGAP